MIFQLPFTVLGSESVSVSHKKEAHGLILKKKMLNRRVCVCVCKVKERGNMNAVIYCQLLQEWESKSQIHLNCNNKHSISLEHLSIIGSCHGFEYLR